MDQQSASPTRTVTHDGIEWLAVLTGGAPPGEIQSIGILFLSRNSGHGVFGRLRGSRSEFDRLSADRLRQSLIAALSGEDD
jgi:hypothetical protein